MLFILNHLNKKGFKFMNEKENRSYRCRITLQGYHELNPGGYLQSTIFDTVEPCWMTPKPQNFKLDLWLMEEKLEVRLFFVKIGLRTENQTFIKSYRQTHKTHKMDYMLFASAVLLEVFFKKI